MIETLFLVVVYLQQISQLIEALCSTATTLTTTLAPAVQFDLFQQKFGVTYENTTVAQQKFAVFKENLDLIAQHNAEFEAGIITYSLVVNIYSDLVSIFLYYLLDRIDFFVLK